VSIDRIDRPGITTDREVPLAMDAAEFRRHGHRLVDQLADLLASIPSRPVTRGESPAAVREALGLGRPLPEQGTDAGALLEETARLLFDHSLFNGHPRFFGYITSSPAPIGMLGELMAAALNANVGGWTLSPAATEVERETVRWIAELIGYPADTGGLLVSGGNMANIVGFYAARAAKAPWNVRALGAAPPGEPRLRVYASSETHTWIQKAADLSGLGTDAIEWIPTDREQRMDLAELERRIAADRAAGQRPFLVVGTGGSVSTGAVDALPAIAALCRRHDLWFHVDGAYGGLAAAAEDCPDDLRGLALADSVAVDPHKWLYSPIEAGCALVRDLDRLTAAFSYHPPYYHFEERSLNYVDLGPQNTRGFRALKVWLALRQAGAAGYRRMIGDDMRLSRAMAEAIAAHADLELVTQALSITTFRYVPADLKARAAEPAVRDYLDALNRRLLETSQTGGETFVSNAVIDGRYVLRACIVNFHTRLADVNAVPEIIARMGRELDATMRPEALGRPAR
jgi:aromatic-L-amino-acid/L-tryptophan decarboxylase